MPLDAAPQRAGHDQPGKPATAARDLLDIGSAAAELAITLEWLGRGLGVAWEHDIDPPRAKLTALRTLRRAQEDLADLIAELAALPVGEAR